MNFDVAQLLIALSTVTTNREKIEIIEKEMRALYLYVLPKPLKKGDFLDVGNRIYYPLVIRNDLDENERYLYYNYQSELNLLHEKYNNENAKEMIKEEKYVIADTYTPKVWANIAKCYYKKYKRKKDLPTGNKFCEKLYEKLEIKTVTFDTFYGYFRKNEEGNSYDNINNFNDLEEIIKQK